MSSRTAAMRSLKDIQYHVNMIFELSPNLHHQARPPKIPLKGLGWPEPEKGPQTNTIRACLGGVLWGENFPRKVRSIFQNIDLMRNTAPKRMQKPHPPICQ